MTIYQHYVNGDFALAIELGIVRNSIIEYFKIYEVFKKHKGNGKTYLDAISLTADDLNLTDSKVRVAVASVG